MRNLAFKKILIMIAVVSVVNVLRVRDLSNKMEIVIKSLNASSNEIGGRIRKYTRKISSVEELSSTAESLQNETDKFVV